MFASHNPQWTVGEVVDVTLPAEKMEDYIYCSEKFNMWTERNGLKSLKPIPRRSGSQDCVK